MPASSTWRPPEGGRAVKQHAQLRGCQVAFTTRWHGRNHTVAGAYKVPQACHSLVSPPEGRIGGWDSLGGRQVARCQIHHHAVPVPLGLCSIKAVANFHSISLCLGLPFMLLLLQDLGPTNKYTLSGMSSRHIIMFCGFPWYYSSRANRCLTLCSLNDPAEKQSSKGNPSRYPSQCFLELRN